MVFCTVKIHIYEYQTTGPNGRWSKSCGRPPAEIVGSNPTGAKIFFCCEFCVWSDVRLCDELIARLEKSYLVSCSVLCDLETCRMRKP
jgi:hypothetical protein